METKRTNLLIALALLVLLFIGINVTGDTLFERAQVDMTDENLYTLSDGTREIIRSNEEPITLTLYYSESSASGAARMQSYADRVISMLDQFERISGGAISVRTVDPEPDSEAETRARNAGLRSQSMPNGDPFYLGLVGTNSTDGRETIRFLNPGEERFLEYELTRLVYKLSLTDKPTVGVLSRLPLDGSRPMPGSPQGAEPWRIMQQMRDLFEVRMLSASVTEIADDIDLLLLVHPKNLQEPARNAIDAYTAAGGALMVFVDPRCESDTPPGAQQNPQAMMDYDNASDLDPLFEAWGVRLIPDSVLTDRELGMQARGSRGNTQYIHALEIGEAYMNENDAVTRGLSSIRALSAGAFETVEGSETELQPLITSSGESMMQPTSNFGLMLDPQQLLADFEPSGTEYPIAARLRGPAASAYGNPTRDAGLNVIVCADADMLNDRMWMSDTALGAIKTADNADFLTSAIDNMAGASALTKIRARGSYFRPFTLVEELESGANDEYQDDLRALREKEREINSTIQQILQARAGQEETETEIILTREQQQRLADMQEQRAEIREQIRKVRYRLGEDVERLGMWTEVANTATMPTFVAIAALVLYGWRAARRRADRRAMAGLG